MKTWIAVLLLAGLAACSGNTATEEKAAEPPAPAATPAEPAPVEPPPAPAATPEAPKEPPKTTAAPAPADKPAAKPEAKPDVPKSSSNRKPGVYALFETSMGNFTAELNEKEAPITVANFVGLASGEKEWTDPTTQQKQKKPFYNGLTFHRVIGEAKMPPEGFMIQGGDPLGDGTGGPGFTIKDEVNNLRHDKAGTLAMARTGLPDSAGSQFYVTMGPQTQLDGRQPPYVVFGYVIEGVDVVKKIGNVATDRSDKPLTPIKISRIRIERVK